MIPCLRVKPGVLFTVIAPGGFELLAAFGAAAKAFGVDFTITSGTDGQHSGPTDPHHLGRAYDLRSQDFPDDDAKQTLIMTVLRLVDSSVEPSPLDGGYATTYFFMWLEDAGTPNEHFHAQVRHGVEYPPSQPGEP